VGKIMVEILRQVEKQYDRITGKKKNSAKYAF